MSDTIFIGTEHGNEQCLHFITTILHEMKQTLLHLQSLPSTDRTPAQKRMDITPSQDNIIKPELTEGSKPTGNTIASRLALALSYLPQFKCTRLLSHHSDRAAFFGDLSGSNVVIKTGRLDVTYNGQQHSSELLAYEKLADCPALLHPIFTKACVCVCASVLLVGVVFASVCLE